MSITSAEIDAVVARVSAYIANRWDSGEYSNPCVSIFSDTQNPRVSHSLYESDLRIMVAALRERAP